MLFQFERKMFELGFISKDLRYDNVMAAFANREVCADFAARPSVYRFRHLKGKLQIVDVGQVEAKEGHEHRPLTYDPQIRRAREVREQQKRRAIGYDEDYDAKKRRY